MTKQVVRFGAAVMTTLLALVVLWQFHVVVAYALISLLLAAVLRPLISRLAGRGSVARTAWILLYLAALGSFGLAGIIVAPLLSVICQILWSHLVSHRLAAGAATQVSDLRERQERLGTAISALEEPHLPLVTSSMARLAQLLAKAEPLLHGAAQPAQEAPHGRT